MILNLTESVLVLDAETSSPVDLKKEGQYRYWENPETRTLMLGQKWLNLTRPAVVTDFVADYSLPLPPETIAAIRAPAHECMLAAANVEFDRAALARVRLPTPSEKWIDILVLAYMLGFAGRLDDVLKQIFRDVTKDPEGTRLITLFSVQRKAWHEEPEKWQRFREYCRQDAEVEERLLRWCLDKLQGPYLTSMVHRIRKQELIYREINRRGIPVDIPAVEGALRIRDDNAEGLLDEMARLTGLTNPNSRDQLLGWCREKGSLMDDLRKETVEHEIAIRKEMPGADNAAIVQVLQMRQEAGKSSVKKFDALNRATSDDGRLRGGWQFYGASRTGRVAGRTLNPANLARPSPKVHAEIVADWLGDP